MREMLFNGRYLSALDLGQGLVEISLDRRDEAVNTLDEHFTAELGTLLELISLRDSLRGVLLTSAKKAFLAGADLKVLLELCERPEAELATFSLDNSTALSRLETLPVPVVVAINGFALGGGLEVALCGDYRVLASDGQVGLPEVGFGIIPGWGGTVRLPRLTNGQIALEWIIGARAHKPQKALADGVVDAIAEPEQLRETALEWLNRAAAGELDWQVRRRERQRGFELDAAALTAARDRAQTTVRFYPAALAVVELIERCSTLDRDTALVHEAQTFAHLARTPTARALVGVFLTNQQMKKDNRQQAALARPVQRAAVLGAGIMGGGIAYTSAVHRVPVRLKDIAQTALDLGIGEARKLLGKQVETGRMVQPQADAVLASIVPQLQFDHFDTVDFVVEAVIENLEVKRKVLAEVEALVKPGTVLASNTSSLSIAAMASALQRPEDLVGMHFFNPVPLMPLVEVIRGPATSEQAVATAVGYANAMGKTPLVVKDCPGFLVNRLLGAYMTAFHALIHDGADFQQIDRVMEAWGWPMGPAYLMDVAGTDTLDKALAILAEAYPDVMAPAYRTAIQLLAAERRYGQKTGIGFYRYESDAKGKPRRTTDVSTYDLLAQAQPAGHCVFEDRQIEERLMLAMLLEAARCLDEQVVASAAEIDIGMRLGTGFPAHHGGPLWYADTLGSTEILRLCDRYSALGGLYAVNNNIEKLLQAGGRFYNRAQSGQLNGK